MTFHDRMEAAKMSFGSIVSRQDQYEVAKAKAEIALVTAMCCTVVNNLPEFLDNRWLNAPRIAS